MTEQTQPIYTLGIMYEAGINKALSRIAHSILEGNENRKNLALVGIYMRGAYLADRLAANIHEQSGMELPVGKIDVTQHRDDTSTLRIDKKQMPTQLDFNVDGRNVILVDDVLYTGRTVRAALAEIMSYGRPDSVQLAVLIDRGNRELPIHPDYVGEEFPTNSYQRVNVRLREMGGVEVDNVVLERRL